MLCSLCSEQIVRSLKDCFMPTPREEASNITTDQVSHLNFEKTPHHHDANLTLAHKQAAGPQKFLQGPSAFSNGNLFSAQNACLCFKINLGEPNIITGFPLSSTDFSGGPQSGVTDGVLMEALETATGQIFLLLFSFLPFHVLLACSGLTSPLAQATLLHQSCQDSQKTCGPLSQAPSTESKVLLLFCRTSASRAARGPCGARKRLCNLVIFLHLQESATH